MISDDIRARILRLYHAECWPIATIARELGRHHSTVRLVLTQAGVPQARHSPRPSKLDPFLPFIMDKLQEFPSIRASRLFHMVRERGYVGSQDHFRSVIGRLRPRPPAEAFFRLRTLPGEQAQVDWGHFGHLQVGRARRKLYGFVLVLSWSRRIFLSFGYDIGMAGFVRGHVQAFADLAGVPRVLLYDNLKSAVLERQGQAIRFNPQLLELAAHYRFEPRPMSPARGNEKGRVERAIQYIRHAFFAAREFKDLEDLNAQARAWCRGQADDRLCPEDRTLTVRQAFAEEQPRLLALPPDHFPALERKEVTVGKTPYVRFDLNDYSVPHDHVRRPLVILASTTRVRVLDGPTVIADHPRSYDQGLPVEDQAHLRGLGELKRAARLHRSQDRLLTAAPQSRFLLQALAERGGNLGSAVAALGRLLDHYGAAEVDAAIAAVLGEGLPHAGAVRQVLERWRHERGLAPPVAIDLQDRPELRNLSVRPHDLAAYDRLTTKENSHD